MKLSCAAVLLVLSISPAWAKDKHPNADFQDATLVSFREVATGSCATNVSSTTGKLEEVAYQNEASGSLN